MDWALDYYTQQSRTFARARVTEAHRSIAARLDAWCRELPSCRRVLELGSGNGGTAAALAALGRDVWAVELNPADVALARQLAASAGPGAVHVVEGDFYEVAWPFRFDFVYYWDGFGIGSDDDQRRLLRRIGTEWLAPEGRALIDVFSPWRWRERHGETSVHAALDGSSWQRQVTFDDSGSRLVDTWSPVGSEGSSRSQTIRCYTLGEIVGLLEGTGLRVDRLLGMDGRVLGDPVREDAPSDYLAATNGFFALLAPDTASSAPESAPRP